MPDSFPVARLIDRPRTAAHLSKLWWLTGACLLFAIGLVWSSSRNPGIAITIQFDNGHGLEVGDSVRHRGIDIGQVHAVTLSEDLSSIIASVSIDPSASAVATEGSRFWIVRPQIDISGVSGLETAVGSKYLAVIPGESGTVKTTFEGLATRPADDQGSAGMELVLRGEDRHGIHSGAPVTWRGIDVGRVLSANLSPNASAVDVRVRIDDGYKRLVTGGSKFWVTSGINIDVGVTGVNINAQSLATIARGGVAMISTASKISDDVTPGSVFTLHGQRDDDWIDSAVAINLLQQLPPATLDVVATWTESFLGINRTSRATSLGIVIGNSDNQAVAVFPADVAVPGKNATEGSFATNYRLRDGNFPIQEPPTIVGSIAKSVFPHELPGGRIVMPDRIRIAKEPEDCFVVRIDENQGKNNVQTPRMQMPQVKTPQVQMMIGRQSISRGNRLGKGNAIGQWNVASGGLSRSMWHGAPVVSAVDERIIGLLIVEKAGARIVPIPVQ